MGNHTFVEFSTAAACYVYNNADHLFQLGDSEYHMTEFRNQLWADHRVIHYNSENYYWQANFASWINSELGIKPLRSYRLGNSEGGIESMQRYQLEDIDKNETDNVAELIQGLRGDKRTWRDSSRALIRIGKPAVPALIDAMRDGDHRVRNRAVYTLGQLGTAAKAAIPLLQKLQLRDRNELYSQPSRFGLKSGLIVYLNIDSAVILSAG